MTEWREVALGDGLAVHHGFAFKGEYFVDDGDLIVLTPGNFVDSGGFKDKSGKEKFYDGPVDDRYLLSRDDVVVAMTEQAHGLLGSSATIPQDARYLHNQRIGLIEITDPSMLDLRFVYHLMNAPCVRQQIQATATGSKVRHTAPERIRAVMAHVPSVPEQRTIGRVLDAIDDLIENNRRRVEVLEEMAWAIYREWFVHFRFPGYEDAAFVDSDRGPIPEGWRASTCGVELDYVGGGTPSKQEPAYWDNGTVDWFTPSDLTKTGLRYPTRSELRITEAGLAKSSAKLVPSGTVMMTSRATLGVLAITTGPASTNQGFISVRPDDRWPPHFVREFLDASEAQLAAIGTGATFKEITKGAFKSFPFVVPEQTVLDKYRAATADAELLLASLERATSQLVAMRDLLLPKLVTGKIDVSNLDLDAVVEKAAV